MPARSCREFMEQYKHPKVNCATCVKRDRKTGLCREELEPVQSYEDSNTFTAFDALMKSNTPVYIT